MSGVVRRRPPDAEATTRLAVLVGGSLCLLAALPVVAVALWVLLQDLAAQGEWLDGVGLVVGATGVAIGLVPALVGWVALRRWRDRPASASAWLLAVFGLLVAVAGWPVTRAVGTGPGAVMVLGGLLVAAVAFLGLVLTPHVPAGRPGTDRAGGGAAGR